MKKILVIAYEFPPIRASNDRTYHFCRYLPSCGWQPIVIAPRKLNPWLPPHDFNLEIPEDLEIHDAPAMEHFYFLSNVGFLRVYLNSALFAWNSFRRGRKILSNRQTYEDVKFIYGTVPTAACMFAAYFLSIKFKKPLVLDFRDPHYPAAIYKKFFLKALAHATKTITTTEVYRDVLIKQGAAPEKVMVLPNGTDLALVQALKEDNINRSKDFTVIYAGGYFKIYRVGTLVRDLAMRLKKENIKFVIVGQPDEGEENLPEFARQNGLRHVEFKGRLSQKDTIKELLKATVAYNGSSHPGGVGGKMYDYLACGLPVLGFSPETSATYQFIRKNEVGLVASDEKTLFENLLSFYNNPSLIESTRNKGLETVRKFDRKQLAQRLSEILNEN